MYVYEYFSVLLLCFALHNYFHSYYILFLTLRVNLNCTYGALVGCTDRVHSTLGKCRSIACYSHDCYNIPIYMPYNINITYILYILHTCAILDQCKDVNKETKNSTSYILFNKKEYNDLLKCHTLMYIIYHRDCINVNFIPLYFEEKTFYKTLYRYLFIGLVSVIIINMSLLLANLHNGKVTSHATHLKFNLLLINNYSIAYKHDIPCFILICLSYAYILHFLIFVIICGYACTYLSVYSEALYTSIYTDIHIFSKIFHNKIIIYFFKYITTHIHDHSYVMRLCYFSVFVLLSVCIICLFIVSIYMYTHNLSGYCCEVFTLYYLHPSVMQTYRKFG